MLGANPYFKRQPVKSMVFTRDDARKMRAIQDIKNTGVARVNGHSRFGFLNMLDATKVPLPTAPAVVGGNVDWTKSKASPATAYLHSFLSENRMMNSAPASGSSLRLDEPNNISIHTTY